MAEKTQQNVKQGYFAGALAELRKVTWPTKNQAVRLTIIVLISCLAAAVFLGVVDYLFNELYKLILAS